MREKKMKIIEPTNQNLNTLSHLIECINLRWDMILIAICFLILAIYS